MVAFKEQIFLTAVMPKYVRNVKLDKAEVPFDILFTPTLMQIRSWRDVRA